jgi:hypothetical protein
MILEPEIRFIAVFVKVLASVDAEEPVIHFSPANSLNIDQMFYCNVLRCDVLPSSAATKCK